MKYGPNTELVDEVIEFAKSGQILSGDGQLGAWDIVNDFADARRIAWEAVVGNEELLWTDIREKEMSEVRGRSCEIEDFGEYRDNLSPLLKTFTLYLRRQLPKQYQDILDDAIGDLYNCAFNRCVYGETDNFFETVFAAYRAGCWPCGWQGDYPSGRLRVFRPQRSPEPT